MLLRDYFRDAGIHLTAYLPAGEIPVIHPHLLKNIPDVRTVVFAAIPYYVTGGDSNLAMFARGRDYHAFARDLGLGAAAVLHDRYPDATAASFADHSPYAEVAGAAMAGLGVIGDHGMLITPAYSSFVFLFELLTSLTPAEIEAEGMLQGDGKIRTCEHCGACTRACPGECIGSGRDRCLSAIGQKKGDLNEDEIRLLRSGNYAWGCDACGMACPHTKRAMAEKSIDTPIPYFRENRLSRLTVQDVETMDEDTYAAYAFGWRRKETMLRNLRLREDTHD